MFVASTEVLPTTTPTRPTAIATFICPTATNGGGLGGIFFDNVEIGTDTAHAHRVLAFVRAAGEAFLSSYLPIVARRIDTPWTPEQRAWQELRRGRYVEFNLLHDRGTVFGLRTNGRTESILMSLPPKVRWEYCAEPPAGSPEADLLDVLRQPLPQEGDPTTRANTSAS